MKNLIEETNEIFGKLDILVSNAGWSYSNKPSIEVTESEIDKLLDINVKSIFFGTVFAVELMKKNIIIYQIVKNVHNQIHLIWIKIWHFYKKNDDMTE